jgi:hypothetical protein
MSMENSKLAVASVKCLSVVAQVSLGYFDDDGNLIGDEMFPQSEESLLTAKLFHPHAEQLATLIQTCVEQAWAKLGAQGRVGPQELAGDEAARDGRMPAVSATGDGLAGEGR